MLFISERKILPRDLSGTGKIFLRVLTAVLSIKQDKNHQFLLNLHTLNFCIEMLPKMKFQHKTTGAKIIVVFLLNNLASKKSLYSNCENDDSKLFLSNFKNYILQKLSS